MNKGKQTTLFQSWGQKKQGGNNAKPSISTVQSASHSDVQRSDIIDLCLEEEDDDDLLLQAMETEQSDADQTTSNGSTTNVCNISLGAESFNNSFSLTQMPAPEGFDKAAGKLWIYPTNYPVRDYQLNIVQQALYKNTMVTLPTGLGKTFISAVVMYNFYRWYPQGKVVFMAPTKPLVAQQIEACYNIMGIPQEHTAEMTGNMAPTERRRVWQERRVFFLTPQVLTNDLSRGTCPAAMVKCLVVDEAHKALGNHAYCQVVRELIKYTENFRILALSATPGSDIKAVQQVLTNLLISHIELRTEESIDIKQYSHERKVEKIVIPLGDELSQVKKQYIKIMEVVVSRLKRYAVLYKRDTCSLSKFLILKAREAFRQNPPENLPRSQYGVVEGDFALAMSLYHGFELLQLHGLRSLHNFLEGIANGEKSHGRTRTELMKIADFTQLFGSLKQKFSPVTAIRPSQGSQTTVGSFVTGHPKMDRLQQIVLDHFNTFSTGDKTGSATRVMIFSQYRDSVVEITAMLKQHQPKVKVMSFIGQSSAGKSTKGFTQKEQLKVMKQFRDGGYNTLVSTCVGEEGLDIGEVDLIICFDAHKSPIRLVQRMGRTGRKREGRIVMLVTAGKEEQIYNQSQYSKRSIHKAILNGAKSLRFYQSNPRMVPDGWQPACHKMHITIMKEYQLKKGLPKTGDTKQIKIKLQSGKNKNTAADDGLITAEEYRELMDYYGNQMDTAKTLPPRSEFLSLMGDKDENQALESDNCLVYNKWLPWQNRLHSTHNISHSTAACNFVEMVEFLELQGALDSSEDPYGQEMALFLNDDDVLKPGESEQPKGQGIRKFCVTMDPEFQDMTDKNKKDRVVRRSVPLPELQIRINSDSDEDLPAFDFGNNEEADLKSCEGNNIDNKKTGADNDRRSSHVGKLKKSKHKLLSKTRPSLMISTPKLDEKTKKSKKKKKKRVSSGSAVEVIADTDNCDFMDVDPGEDHVNLAIMCNDTNSSRKNVKSDQTAETNRFDKSVEGIVVCNPDNHEDGNMDISDTVTMDAGNSVSETDNTRFSQLLPLLGSTFLDDCVEDSTSYAESCFPCVRTPPPVEQVEEIVQNLGNCDKLPPLDLLTLVDEWEKDNKIYSQKCANTTDINKKESTNGNNRASNDLCHFKKASRPVSDICIRTTNSITESRLNYQQSQNCMKLTSEMNLTDKLKTKDNKLLNSDHAIGCEKDDAYRINSPQEESSDDRIVGSDRENRTRKSNGEERTSLSNMEEIDSNVTITSCLQSNQELTVDTSDTSGSNSDNLLISPVFNKSQMALPKQMANITKKDASQSHTNFTLENAHPEQRSTHPDSNSDLSDDFCDTQANFMLAEDELFEDIDVNDEKSFVQNDENRKVSTSEKIEVESCKTSYESGKEKSCDAQNLQISPRNKSSEVVKNNSLRISANDLQSNPCTSENKKLSSPKCKMTNILRSETSDRNTTSAVVDKNVLKVSNDSLYTSADQSLFDDSFNVSVLNAVKTPQEQHCSPSQITFTQALACVHDNNGTHSSDESDTEPEEKESCHTENNFTTTTKTESTVLKANSPNSATENEEKKLDIDRNRSMLINTAIGNNNDVDSDSGESLELPHFDLGFNIDDDIIPPSPCASQSISQISFSSRLSQSLLGSRKSLGSKFNASVTENKDNRKTSHDTENKPAMAVIDEESFDISKNDNPCDEIDEMFNGSLDDTEEKVNDKVTDNKTATSESDGDSSPSLIRRPKPVDRNQPAQSKQDNMDIMRKKRTAESDSGNSADSGNSDVTKSPSPPKQRLVGSLKSSTPFQSAKTTPVMVSGLKRTPSPVSLSVRNLSIHEDVNRATSHASTPSPVKSATNTTSSSASPPKVSPQLLKDMASPSSDDEIIVRKKRKRAIIESPVNTPSPHSTAVSKQSRYDSPFKTPIRPFMSARPKSKFDTATGIIQNDGHRNQQPKKLNVSFNLPQGDYDEDDFDVPSKQITRKHDIKRPDNVKNNSKKDAERLSHQRTSVHSSKNSKKQHKKHKSPADMFIDAEAMLSDEEGKDSGDEEEGSDWDEMDDSFVTFEATQLSQNRQEDLHAFYLESIKSPPGGRMAGNKFRLQYDYAETNVFSQTCRDEEEESQYMADSFVVNDDFEETHVEYGTEVDPISDEETDPEVTFIGRRTRWSKPIARKRKPVKRVLEGRRRIRKIADSSSEEEDDVMVKVHDITLDREKEDIAIDPQRKNRKPVFSSSTSDEDQSFAPTKSKLSYLLSVDKIKNYSHKMEHSSMTRIKDNQSNKKDNSSLSSKDEDEFIDSQEIIPSLMSRIKSKAVNMNLSMTQKDKVLPEVEGEGNRSRCSQSSVTADQLREERLKRQREKQEAFRRKMEEKLKTQNKNETLSSDNEQDLSVNNRMSISSIVPCTKNTVDVTSSDKNKPDEFLLVTSIAAEDKSKPVIFVDSKEISGGQNIVSDLRFQHNMKVVAAQLGSCDYVVSNRMAIDRKLWSDFSNGSNRSKLLERIQLMCDLYDRPCLIIETDPVKAGDKGGGQPLHWTKYVDKTLVQLLHSKVKLFFTNDQKQTAAMLADLCQLEVRKNMSVKAPVDICIQRQQLVKFYTSIPRLTYIHALNLVHNFRSLSEFISGDVKTIRDRGCMSQQRAMDVYNYVRRTFDTQMLPTNYK